MLSASKAFKLWSYQPNDCTEFQPTIAKSPSLETSKRDFKRIKYEEEPYIFKATPLPDFSLKPTKNHVSLKPPTVPVDIKFNIDSRLEKWH